MSISTQDLHMKEKVMKKVDTYSHLFYEYESARLPFNESSVGNRLNPQKDRIESYLAVHLTYLEAAKAGIRAYPSDGFFQSAFETRVTYECIFILDLVRSGHWSLTEAEKTRLKDNLKELVQLMERYPNGFTAYARQRVDGFVQQLDSL